MSETLLDRILSGSNRQLQVLAAQGLVPLVPDELIPIQVALTESPDTEVSNHAVASLQALDYALISEFLRERAGQRELAWFGQNSGSGAVVEIILRRRDIARSTLISLAPGLTPDLQEVLVLRQDAIIDEPEILVALERNPQLSNYTKRRIWEYREHLLPRDKVPPKSAEEIQAEADAITEVELAEAIIEVKAKAVAGATDEIVDEKTQLTDVQIRMLPVPMRMKLARNANRQVRGLLIRDTNSMVALAVLTSNSLPDTEVEQIANSRSVCDEVLAEIPKKREWIGRYSIAKALIKNPKTQLALAVKLLTRMSVKDLRELARDKNAQEGVRAMALRMYQAKKD